MHLFVCFMVLILSVRCDPEPDPSPIPDGHRWESEAVVGGKAKLPCSLASDIGGDRPTLVLWYKDKSGAPIYSFDARDKPLSLGSHWMDNFILGSKNAHFDLEGQPPALTVDNVVQSDAGVYRCRVDFQMTPTKYSRVNLTVIIPPDPPVIRLMSGKRVVEHYGPLTTGDTVKFSCETSGGKPKPSLSWWKDGVLISRNSVKTPTGKIRNVLTVPPITRANVDLIYTCSASNSNVSVPLSESVKLDVYLKPLMVRIEGQNRRMSLGRRYTMRCVTAGSRPPAKITWWLGQQRLSSSDIHTSADSNVTTSQLKFLPTREHNGKHLTCTVANPRFSSDPISDSWRIVIDYPPQVQIKLGSSLLLDNVKEGDDVYFECLVSASPPIHRLEWLHDGQLLLQNVRSGIIMSNMSLVLQRVNRSRSGNYACRAANVEDETTSHPIQLSVQHAPVCARHSQVVYQAFKYEMVEIKCSVDANPSDVKFEWKLNNSAEVVDLNSKQGWIKTSRTSSVLSLTPTRDLDYGTVECTSSNEIGKQREPCVFKLIPTASEVTPPSTLPPDSPKNCSIVNRTAESLRVSCGASVTGIWIKFHLLAYEAKSRRLLSNLTGTVPLFEIRDLGPGQEVQIQLYATNPHGRSPPITLEADTLKVAQLTTRPKEPGGFSMTPLLAILLGAVAVILLLALIVWLTVRRVRRREQPDDRDGAQSREKMLQTTSFDECLTSDKSPDVVPCNHGCSHDSRSHSSLSSRRSPPHHYDPRLSPACLRTFPQDEFHLISKLPGIPSRLPSPFYGAASSVDLSEPELACLNPPPLSDRTWHESVV